MNQLVLFLFSENTFPLLLWLFGLLFGSFSNVVIHRLKKGGSIWIDRSKCPKCKHKLSALDLIPVFSWVYLKGKCRYCKKKIAWQYSLVELTLALLWGIIAAVFGVPAGVVEILQFLFALFLSLTLLIISVYDLKHYEIPDQVSLPLILISGLMLFSPLSPSILSAILGCVFVYSFFYLQILIPASFYAQEKKNIKILWQTLAGYVLFPIWLFLSIFLPQKWVEKIPGMNDENEEEIPAWIGGGDLRLAFVMGLVLGVKASIVALFIAYLTGAIGGVILMMFAKKGRKSMIPFGPYLAIGTLLAFLFGEPLWNWYWTFLAI